MGGHPRSLGRLDAPSALLVVETVDMTRREIIDILTPWVAHCKAVAALEASLEPLRMELESPIYAVPWGLLDAYTDEVERRLGIHGSGWLSWWHHEDSMGKRGLEAGWDGNMRPIKGLSGLVWLIENERAKR